MSLIVNFRNDEISNWSVKSHHLVINLGLGPTLKCAPGRDSIKDSNIIKVTGSKVELWVSKSGFLLSEHFWAHNIPSHRKKPGILSLGEAQNRSLAESEAWIHSYWPPIPPPQKKCPGNFSVDGTSPDPAPRKRFPGNVFPGAESKFKEFKLFW